MRKLREMKTKSLKDAKIAVVGVGMVGGALARYFKGIGREPLLYDPYKKMGSKDDTNKADIIFISVPTPFKKKEGGFDLSYVKETCDFLDNGKVVVIKSTIVPGTTEKLQTEYPHLKFLFNPEFLSEATADYDFLNPDRQLVGFTKESKEFAQDIMDLLPRSPHEKLMPATEAEIVKYFNNTFNAIKVIFGNQMYDLCEALGIDYDNVADSAAASKFIRTKDHLDVHHGGYRGYGGKCLPKDTRALIQLADSLGVNLLLHKTAEEINNQLMETQGIEDPERFSKRE